MRKGDWEGVGSWAASVCWDIRNPLNPFQLFSGSLKRPTTVSGGGWVAVLVGTGPGIARAAEAARVIFIREKTYGTLMLGPLAWGERATCALHFCGKARGGDTVGTEAHETKRIVLDNV